MLRAIDLDHELGAVTHEIHDVRAECGLPADMRARNRNSVEMPPQPLFSWRHGAPEGAGARGSKFLGARHEFGLNRKRWRWHPQRLRRRPPHKGKVIRLHHPRAAEISISRTRSSKPSGETWQRSVRTARREPWARSSRRMKRSVETNTSKRCSPALETPK